MRERETERRTDASFWSAHHARNHADFELTLYKSLDIYWDVTKGGPLGCGNSLRKLETARTRSRDETASRTSFCLPWNYAAGFSACLVALNLSVRTRNVLVASSYLNLATRTACVRPRPSSHTAPWTAWHTGMHKWPLCSFALCMRCERVTSFTNLLHSWTCVFGGWVTWPAPTDRRLSWGLGCGDTRRGRKRGSSMSTAVTFCKIRLEYLTNTSTGNISHVIGVFENLSKMAKMTVWMEFHSRVSR